MSQFKTEPWIESSFGIREVGETEDGWVLHEHDGSARLVVEGDRQFVDAVARTAYERLEARLRTVSIGRSST